MRTRRNALRGLGFVLFVAVVALIPSRISDFRASELALVGISFIAVLGLNILTGYTGVISLGHGAFMALGAYTTALLMLGETGLEAAQLSAPGWLPLPHDGWKDVFTIPVAALVAALAGALFGLPALRLLGPYLALATFGIAVATPIVIKKFDEVTGGTGGLSLFESPNLTGAIFNAVHVPGRTLTFNDWLYYLTWTIALALFVVTWVIHHSRLGRALRAIRDDEIAATASGVWLASHKTLAFTISAFYAGVAGSLLAISAFSVQPGAFPAERSIFLLVALAIGGMGSLVPLVAGAAFLVYVPQLAEKISNAPGAPGVLYGAALILIMFLLPTGLGGLLRRVLMPFTNRLYSRP